MKHSKKLEPSDSAFSSAVVCLIYASVASTSSSRSSDLPLSRVRDFLAMSILSLRTAFHGDSGQKYPAMNNGRGQTHCKMNGSRHPIFPSTTVTARTTPDERSCPPPQHMQTYAVTYGLRTVGTISHAYVVESVWKTPQGIPHRASPKASTSREGVNTGTKMARAIHAMKNM